MTTEPKSRLAADTPEAIHATKQSLIAAGLPMLLKHGYSDLGLQTLLKATGIPKGSFYYHFKSKEDFVLQVLDSYMVQVHAGLDACLADETRPALERVRAFFESTQQSYKEEGYMGCLMGGLGQELSGISELFRHRIEGCFAGIAERMAECLGEAQRSGDIPSDRDVRLAADLLVDCWEGAALRSRIRRNPASLNAMLDFYLRAVATD